MSAALTLATPEHLPKLLPLIAAFQTEEGVEVSEEHRLAAVSPLLEGQPYGVIYLIGPPRAPIGYIVISFGWSLEFGGLDAIIDELYIRKAVRGRGIATEVLATLPKALGEAGVRAMHLEVHDENASAERLYQRAGFRKRSRYHLMSLVL